MNKSTLEGKWKQLLTRRFATTVLVALSAILTLNACAGGGEAGIEPAPSARTISIEAGEYAFAPGTFTAKVGEELTFEITNNGTLEHNFVVLDPSGSELTRTNIAVGATASVTVMPLEAGTFAILCDIPGHREAGMEAILTVG